MRKEDPHTLLLPQPATSCSDPAVHTSPSYITEYTVGRLGPGADHTGHSQGSGVPQPESGCRNARRCVPFLQYDIFISLCVPSLYLLRAPFICLWAQNFLKYESGPLKGLFDARQSLVANAGQEVRADFIAVTAHLVKDGFISQADIVRVAGGDGGQAQRLQRMGNTGLG